MSSKMMRDPFHGVFEWRPGVQDRASLSPTPTRPETVPDPETGRPLKIATVEVSERGVCPACERPGRGGYVSFVSDLRLAFACPSCQRLVWLTGT